MEQKLSMEPIYGIVKAAERVGGIHNLEMPHTCKTWRDCVRDGYMFYSNATTHSTGVIKL